MAGLKIPLLAIQILWINLVTDGLPAIALGFEPAEGGVMKRKPRAISESVFAGGLGTHIVWASILLTSVTLISYVFGYGSHEMNPLSPTLALEYRTSAQLTELIGEESSIALVPADWDVMSLEERSAVLLSHEQDTSNEETGSGGIIGAAEQYPRTIAFSVLALGQIFHVIAIHAGDRETFFKHRFSRNRILLYAVISTFLLQLGVIYLPVLQRTFETVALPLPQLALTFVLAAMMFVGVETEKYLRRRGIITNSA
ncbi:MAG: cation-translocating P-type ATPase C-terminal domain-containing protein [Anaerolineae bacterium]